MLRVRPALPLLFCLTLAACNCVDGGFLTVGVAAADTNSCGEPQTMQITPNSHTLSSSLSNPNNAIQIAFLTGEATYWTAMVSTANLTVSLANNRGNAVVTFQQGLTIASSPKGEGKGFDLFLTGTIIDDTTVYTLTGAYLGAFRC